MLDTILTLSVDAANDGNAAPIVYNRYDSFPDRSVYIGPLHSLTSRDTLGFYRTAPKKSGNSRGVAKSAFKITQDQNVPGVDSTTTITQPLLLEVSANVPVGTPVSEEIRIRQKAIALLDEDILMLRLMNKLEV